MNQTRFWKIGVLSGLGWLLFAAVFCLVSAAAEATTPKNTIVTTIVIGSPTSAIVVSPDNRFVYVASPSIDTVSVIDTSINDITTTIPDVGGAQFLAISPDGQALYAAGFDSSATEGKLYIISTANNTVTKTVKLGNGHTHFGQVAVKPDGTEVYVGSDAGDISIVDTSTDKISTINLSSPIFDIVFKPDGTSAYVTYALGVDSAIAKIDTSSKKVVNKKVAETTLPARNKRGALTNLAINPTVPRLYVVDDETGTQSSLETIDIQDNTWLSTVYSKPNHGAAFPAVTPNGKYLYFTIGTVKTAKIVTVALAHGNFVGQSIPVAGATVIAPSGNFAYVWSNPEGGQGLVTVVDISPQ
jgi:YVTN family beta-propeller protein